MHKAAGEDKALTTKEKELISLGISICIRCDGCVACHVKGAIGAGAPQEEIVETIGFRLL
jgi:AhpD family alkylhydroperoxidase